MSTPQTMHNVFAYGSLMFSDIMQELLGKTCQGQPATLSGWSRHALLDRSYPGAVPSNAPDAHIPGVLWTNLNEADMQILDQFESHEYDKVTVQVLTGSGTICSALVYAWKDASALLGSWDVEQFEQQTRPTFVQAHRDSQASNPAQT